ncbi:unnamed protein product [Staurois parvus]|uniref:Alkaline phosphatase n=1 Tax=Staurois parvus TaxID=386267 RepID=A0ABN9FJT6_9NEOB|nr:unnamed protein product [Staurois parvus]
MRGPGRADIVNAGSRESGYSECRVWGESDIDVVNAGSGGRADIVNAGSGGRADIVNAGSGGRADTVNAGSGESGYSECGVQGERIQ